VTKARTIRWTMPSSCPRSAITPPEGRRSPAGEPGEDLDRAVGRCRPGGDEAALPDAVDVDEHRLELADADDRGRGHANDLALAERHAQPAEHARMDTRNGIEVHAHLERPALRVGRGQHLGDGPLHDGRGGRHLHLEPRVRDDPRDEALAYPGVEPQRGEIEHDQQRPTGRSQIAGLDVPFGDDAVDGRGDARMLDGRLRLQVLGLGGFHLLARRRLAGEEALHPLVLRPGAGEPRGEVAVVEDQEWSAGRDSVAHLGADGDHAREHLRRDHDAPA
jgi:hypothetical protein